MSFGSVGRIRSISARRSCGHVDLVHPHERPHAQVDALLLAVLGDHVRLFGAQLDPGHVAQPHDGAAAVGDDQVAELLDRAEVGVGQQVDLDQVALGLAHGREVVVAPERRGHVARGQVERGQPLGIDPDPHGELAAAFDRDPLHARQGGELRLQRAQQPVADGGHVAVGRGEAQVERGVGPVRSLHLDHRRLGLRRQLRPHLLQPGRDLRQRGGGVVVELEADGDRADPGAAGRLHVVHAADRRDRALDRGREEAAHRLGAGPVVDGRDDDRRALDLGILLHRQGHERAPAHDQQHEIDDRREDGMPDEDVGEGAHAISLRRRPPKSPSPPPPAPPRAA